MARMVIPVRTDPVPAESTLSETCTIFLHFFKHGRASFAYSYEQKIAHFSRVLWAIKTTEKDRIT